MDSHRRHELEHNSLFQALTRLPAFAAEYGAYILLGLAVLVALYFYFSTRSTAALQEREAEAVGLYSMGLTVDTARDYRDRVARLGNFITRDDVATQLADFASEFEAYSMLPATSQRPGIRARSLRLRGDFNWTLAAFGGIAHGTAATQPATQPATEPAATTRPDDSPTQAYLAAAETAYREVVEKYPQQTADSLAATFGLAAIAEQRGEFAAARSHYDAVLEREDAPEGPKTLARQRKAMLEILSLHPRLAKPVPPATQPATAPSTAPATQPAAEPATNPAAPATQPVGQ